MRRRVLVMRYRRLFLRYWRKSNWKSQFSCCWRLWSIRHCLSREFWLFFHLLNVRKFWHCFQAPSLAWNFCLAHRLRGICLLLQCKNLYELQRCYKALTFMWEEWYWQACHFEWSTLYFCLLGLSVVDFSGNFAKKNRKIYFTSQLSKALVVDFPSEHSLEGAITKVSSNYDPS